MTDWISDLTFKVVIINMFREIKETRIKQKDDMITVVHQMEHTNTKLKIKKRTKWKFWS